MQPFVFVGFTLASILAHFCIRIPFWECWRHNVKYEFFIEAIKVETDPNLAFITPQFVKKSLIWSKIFGGARSTGKYISLKPVNRQTAIRTLFNMLIILNKLRYCKFYIEVWNTAITYLSLSNFWSELIPKQKLVQNFVAIYFVWRTRSRGI